VFVGRKRSRPVLLSEEHAAPQLRKRTPAVTAPAPPSKPRTQPPASAKKRGKGRKTLQAEAMRGNVVDMTTPAAAPSTSTPAAPHQPRVHVVAADVNKIVTAVDQLSTVLTTKLTSAALNQKPAAPAAEETQSKKTTEFLMKWDEHQFNMHEKR
jgi:hypothetical protein